MAGPVGKMIQRSTTKLRYPWLLAITVVLFGLDLVVPDVIPFVDEVLLGLGAVILARLRVRRVTPAPHEPGVDVS
ncbi:MAG: hypothetical protein OEY20_00480 [Gemmatimonadota bacterium]|nr:hypothetical protein [Gemmatimonadota bacterium]MDH4351455.1 hypothetical protein [Gemmatimonadota bacterium]MDH5195707.1 hypothetical protein [Gemmatimonadota bacterium]